MMPRHHSTSARSSTTSRRERRSSWEALPYFSEFDPSGQLVFNAEFPGRRQQPRAYVLPWHPDSSR